MNEHQIRETIISLFNRLCELALRRLGLWGSSRPRYVDVHLVWELEVWWELEVPRVLNLTRLGDRAAATMRTGLNQLAETLAAAGGDPATTRGAVLGFRDRWAGWARRVAVTESTRIASETALSTRAALEPGARKQWVTEHDDRVRESHRTLNGDVRLVIEPFWTTEGPIRYPGDPLGPPMEVVGCRCWIRIVGTGETK